MRAIPEKTVFLFFYGKSQLNHSIRTSVHAGIFGKRPYRRL